MPEAGEPLSWLVAGLAFGERTRKQNGEARATVPRRSNELRQQQEERVAEESQERSVAKELVDLRREVLESRNLVIKTDNLLKNLHAELKVVSKRNDDHFKRTWISTGAAYGIFLLLAATVAWLGARNAGSDERAKGDSAEKAPADAAKARDASLAELATLKANLERGRLASERALSVFRTLGEKDEAKRLRGVEELVKLDLTHLSPLEKAVLDDRAKAAREEVGQAAFERGRSAFRRQDLKTAIGELKHFLELQPQSEDAKQANFFLGTAYYQQKDFASAVAPLEAFAAEPKGQRNVDYAMYLLGQSLEQTGQHARAAEVYKKAAADYPSSDFITQIQYRFKIASKNALGPAAATPPSDDSAAAPPSPTMETVVAAVAPAKPPAPATPPAPRPAAAGAPDASVP